MYNMYHLRQAYGGYQPNMGYYEPYRQINIHDAINIAVERVPGQVVKVELEQKGGNWIYEVDIVTSQNVEYEVEVDIQTGTILNVKLD